ncbi:hypothetical protein HMPREF9120_00622 [Neisseria sp. oral taxon 020 str. F0370]|nr:hypothetical protein HMPREF9120_00622 [Neisseria sp. oral taxon 020 str. F0370]
MKPNACPVRAFFAAMKKTLYARENAFYVVTWLHPSAKPLFMRVCA